MACNYCRNIDDHAPHGRCGVRLFRLVFQGMGNKLMDLAFEEFMTEIGEELADVVMTTELCQAKDQSRRKVCNS